MNIDAPSPLQRSLRWSFPGFVFASIVLMPLLEQWQQALFTKLGWVNPIAHFSFGNWATIFILLLIPVTAYASWKATIVLEKDRNSLGKSCLIAWNILIMIFAGISSGAGILFTLVTFIQ